MCLKLVVLGLLTLSPVSSKGTLEDCFKECKNKVCLKKPDSCGSCLDKCVIAGEKMARGKTSQCLDQCSPKYDESNWRTRNLIKDCDTYCAKQYADISPTSPYTGRHKKACSVACKPTYPFHDRLVIFELDVCKNSCNGKDDAVKESCTKGCQPVYTFKDETVPNIMNHCKKYCSERHGKTDTLYRDNMCVKGCSPMYPRASSNDKRIHRLCKMHCMMPAKEIDWYY